MPGAVTLPTGGPRLFYTGEFGEVSLQLPLPSYNRHMAAEYVDETFTTERESHEVTAPVGPSNRRQFNFGYEFSHLSEAQAEALIDILSRRIVSLQPRTLAASDPPEAADQVETVVCHVISDVPVTEHVTRGYDIEITLLEAGPLYAPPVFEGSPDTIPSAEPDGPGSTGESDPIEEPPGGEPGPQGPPGPPGEPAPGTGSCYEQNEAVAVIAAGTLASPYVTTLVPPFKNLNDPDYRFDAQPRSAIADGVEVRAEPNPATFNEVRAVLELGQYSGGPSLDANVTVDIKITRYLKESPECWGECWFRNKMHNILSDSACWAKDNLPAEPEFEHALWWLGPPILYVEVAQRPFVYTDADGVDWIFFMEDFESAGNGQGAQHGPNPGGDWNAREIRAYRARVPRWEGSGIGTTDGPWEKLTPLLRNTSVDDERFWPLTAILNGVIYCTHTDRDGTGVPFQRLARYDWDADAWVDLASIGTPGTTQNWWSTEGSLWAAGGYLWLVGSGSPIMGTQPNGRSNAYLIWRYDPVANAWTYNQNWMWPVNLKYVRTAPIFFEGKTWFFGGARSNVGESFNIVRSWNHTDAAGWAVEQTMPYAACWVSPYISNDLRLHILGGADIQVGQNLTSRPSGDTQPPSTWVNTHYAYDPVAGAHQALDLPVQARKFGGVVTAKTTPFGQIGYDGKPRDVMIVLPSYFDRSCLGYAAIDYLPGVRSPYSGEIAI